MSRLTRTLRFTFVAGLALGLLGLIAAGAGYVLLAPGLPAVESLRDVEYEEPLRVYAADGSFISEFGERRREPVDVTDVPADFLNAFIAAEDQRFYEHPGVDYQGILRAVWYLVRTGEKGPGGSTITMQVARNFFLTREQTYLRKIREILLALKINRELTKEQVLELYVNKIYLGQRAYGIGAASKVYYGKPVTELTLAQMAMIAGLPKAPSAWNPIADPERALERRAYVLRRMREQGFITEAEHDQAAAAPITAEVHSARIETEAPWVAEMVRRRMIDVLGEDATYGGGYAVYTTLDAARQEAANDALVDALHAYDERHGWRGPVASIDVQAPDGHEALRARLREVPPSADLINAVVTAVDEDSATLVTAPAGAAPVELPFEAMAWARPFVNRETVGAEPTKPADVLAVGDVVRLRRTAEGLRLAQTPQVEGALVSIDPRDGHLVALVGGYDFEHSKFNRVTQAERQPGSSFKPFIYSSALAHGYTPATLVNDAPVVFDDEALETVWRPENYSGRFFGPTRLRQALIKSRNLVSIRVLRDVGVQPTIEHIQRFGFREAQLPDNLSLALGSASVTPLQMVRGYSVFANGGHLVMPWFIRRIEDREGNVVFESNPEPVCPDCDGEPKDEVTAQEQDGSEADAGMSTGARDDASVAEGRGEGFTASIEGEGLPPVFERVLPADNAYLIRSMMQDVVRYGTGRRAMSLGRNDLAGKTGTTNQQRDAWFAGYNHALVTAAWVGFDEVAPLGRGETGGRTALPMWLDYMGAALKGVPEKPLRQPPGLVTVRIDSDSGLVTSADNPDAIFETFRVGNVPERGNLASSPDGGGESEGASVGGGAPDQGIF